jgi:hypothetical protein
MGGFALLGRPSGLDTLTTSAAPSDASLRLLLDFDVLTTSGLVLDLLPLGRRFGLDGFAAEAAACRSALVRRTMKMRIMALPAHQ